MNEIGALLVEAREKQDLEIEQVSRETNIARDYIIALETDNYEVFPAEPYIQGFLRNYTEYLGLDSEEMLTLYKQIKIQESALPSEALLPKKDFHIPKTVFIVIASLALLAGIITLIYFSVTKWIPDLKADNETEVVEKVVQKRELVSRLIDKDKLEIRLFERDELKLRINDKEHVLRVSKISPDLSLETELGTQIVELGGTLTLDLNNDSIPDIQVTVQDIDKKDPTRGVALDVLTGEAVNSSAEKETQDIVVSENNLEKKNKNYQVLFDSGSAYPVTLNATFRGYCLFRCEIDKKQREERYYQKGEQLTTQANNGFRVWASNGNVVKLQVVAGGKTVDLQVSRPGEIIVKDLKWIKDDSSKRYKFIAIDVD